MKVTPKKAKGSTRNPSHTTLTDADIDRLSAAITTAIIAAQEAPKKQETNEPPKRRKTTVKDVLWIFFCPLKKLKLQNSALSLIKLITSVVCRAISVIGYCIAVIMAMGGAVTLLGLGTTHLEAIAVTAPVLQILLAIIIWLMSRLIAAAGIEIEQTDNENLVFGVSAFILAIIAIIVSM